MACKFAKIPNWPMQNDTISIVWNKNAISVYSVILCILQHQKCIVIYYVDIFKKIDPVTYIHNRIHVYIHTYRSYVNVTG